MSSTNRYTARDYAALALGIAVQALAKAERAGRGDDEILPLCDEVIRRRVRLQLAEMTNGREPGREIRTQIARDRRLLLHSGGVGTLGQHADTTSRYAPAGAPNP